MSVESLVDKEMHTLMLRCREAIEETHRVAMRLNTPPRELTCLTKYSNIYSKTTVDKHFESLRFLYNQYREEFLSVLEDDNWLRMGSVTLQFGSGGKTKPPASAESVTIMISSIYAMACMIRDEQVRTAPTVVGVQVLRPQAILLHLYRIFYHLIPLDRESLGRIVTRLESNLNVAHRTVPVSQAPTATPEGGINVSQIMNTAVTFLSRIGLEPPPGMSMPSEQDLSRAITDILSNEDTIKTIASAMSTIRNGIDIEKGVQQAIAQSQLAPSAVPSILQPKIDAPTVEVTSDASRTDPPPSSGEFVQAINGPRPIPAAPPMPAQILND